MADPRLEQALINADKAGDTDAAKMLAAEIQKTKTGPTDTGPTNAGKTGLDQVKRVAGATVETPLHAATGMLATPIAGLAGLADTVLEGGEEGAKTVETVQNALTYNPRTEGGKLGTQGLDAILGLLPKAAGKAGEATLKATGSPALAAGVDTAIQAAPALLGAKSGKPVESVRADPLRTAAHESQQAGYVLPTNQARPNLLNNLADSLAGKIKTQQLASLKNQGNTQMLIKRGLGLKDDAELNPESLKSLRAEAGKAYEALNDKTLPRVHPGVKFYDELNSVLGDYTEAGRTFKESAKSPIQGQVRSIAKDIRDAKGFDPSSGIAMSRILRDRATAAFQKGEKAEGQANKRMANAIEDEVERSLPKDKPDLIKNFRQARQRIAQSYDVESAMNPVTGNVDARVMGRHLKSGTPYTGDLKTVAKQGAAFPKTTQLPEQIGDYSDYSPLDYGVGIMAESVSKAAGGNPAEAGAIFSRGPVRHALLSDWYQKNFGRAPSPNELQKIQKSLSRVPKEKQAIYLSALSQEGNQ